MKESDLLHSAEGIGGNEKISMGDILQSIDADKFEKVEDKNEQRKEKAQKSDGTINTTKIRKQMKTLKKDAQKSPALSKPLSGRK